VTKKALFVSALLALSALCFAAKSYDVILTSPTKAGSAELKPGQYRLKVDGANAVFTSSQNLKTFTAPVKVQTGEKKFGTTRVDTTNENGTRVIKEIDLGGTNTTLEFGL
jgi:hypothetical protein